MEGRQISAGNPLRFTVRELLIAIAVVAIACSWYSSHQRASRELARLNRQLEYFRNEADYGKMRREMAAESALPPKAKRKLQGVLSSARLESVDLHGLNVTGVFQKSVFDRANLEGATLTGDSSSFQLARFDGANLKNATFVGGNAAFQGASFAEADLSNATVSGGPSSFQLASFRMAKLVGARIITAPSGFQSVNIDGAQFQGADLSTIDRVALESCFFETPPLFDASTRFPSGFDPSANLWERAP